MDFAKFQKLVEKRTGFRTMENPMASGEYFSDSCGDLYTYFLKVGPGDVIEDISYFTTGCGFGTATCSLLVELARGQDDRSGLRDHRADDHGAALGGYPEKKRDYPERSLAALRAAIDDYRAKRERRQNHRRDARRRARNRSRGGRRRDDLPGNGKTSQDEAAAPKVLADAGKVVIKLH